MLRPLFCLFRTPSNFVGDLACGASSLPSHGRARIKAQSLLLLCLLLLAAQGWAKHSNRFLDVPFKLYHDHMIVAEGSLGQLVQRRIIIDTGTTPSMVDLSVAHQLGLDDASRRVGSISVIDGVVQAYFSILPSLSLGPVHRESLMVAVTDLRWLRAQTGVQIDAIVGLDVLERLNFQIDYESRKIRFGNFRVPRSAVPVAEDDQLLSVQAQLNGKAVKLMVDTGGTGLVLFENESLKSTNRIDSTNDLKSRDFSSSDRSNSDLANLAGHTTLRTIHVKELRIGDASLNNSVAVLAKNPTHGDFQGILGISDIWFSRVDFDFHHHLVGFELKDTSAPGDFEAARCNVSRGSLSCREWFGIPRVPLIR